MQDQGKRKLSGTPDRMGDDGSSVAFDVLAFLGIVCAIAYGAAALLTRCSP